MQPRAYSYVRFSSPEQKKGDSLRRQTELAEKYCRERGLVLDNSLRLTDEGLSAFHGKHRTQGALGQFLKLVEEGRICKGSVLLVENLDRLSREQVLDALSQFTSIIKAGVKVVTLQDKMEYCEESINANWAQLIVSITYMARAHSESDAKATRIRAAWANKREQLREKKLTGNAPAWLRLEDNRFTIIPEIADAVRLIYRKRLEGKGAARIETEMNEDPHVWKPPVSGKRNRTGGWRKSYIAAILRSRAVLGEFQPHVRVDGKRKPVGDVIREYYPQVVDSDTFYQVQVLLQIAAKSGNQGRHPGGNPGKVNNLFTHVVRCGLCGGSMHFIDTSKGFTYLACDAARRLKTCDAKPIRYSEFERLFFENFEEIDVDQLIGEGETQTRLTELEKQLMANQQRINEIADEIENLSDSIARTKDSRVREQLEKKLAQALDTRELLAARDEELSREIMELKQQEDGLEEGIERATEVYHLLEAAKSEDERTELRLRLRQQIQRMVERIEVYPLQEEYNEIQETDEPGIVKLMRSRYIDRVRIKFRGSRNLRVLYLKSYAELIE